MGRSIIKTYIGGDKIQRVEHLKNTYHLLMTKKVPHTDTLKHQFGGTVILSPRGIVARPQNQTELLAALTCVLEALEASNQ